MNDERTQAVDAIFASGWSASKERRPARAGWAWQAFASATLFATMFAATMLVVGVSTGCPLTAAKVGACSVPLKWAIATAHAYLFGGH